MSLLKDWGEHEDTYAEALCSVVNPHPQMERGSWLARLNLPFDPSPKAVAKMKELCLRCPLTTTCRDEGVGAEYGVWAGELHEPELTEEEALGAGA